ncbi:MFS transporter [Glycomyces buryatensis]|uniref:MFS transporter n=1 Tax=Glycomyces buryatensis TaxID=2570927 RepID=A0A4S8QCI2_9ACTN|nr:MFS transporter [Glycomyces buryatensis]THV42237.1 MFS transporter [Glycomyces buryatensis]
MTTATEPRSHASLKPATVFLGFAVFGMLWGLYAASIPAIKDQTGASDGALGTAMMCVALAAAPAMFLTGGLLDRFGRPVVIAATVLFAVVAALPALAGSLPMLMVALLLFGLGSGAFDVVINSMAATVEAEQDVRVMNRAHALFSVGLMAGAVITGAARTIGLAPWMLLASAGLLAIVGIAATAHRVPRFVTRERPPAKGRKRIDRAVLGFGLLVALALLVESGVQQWSAVFLEDEVGTPAAISGLAPAIFAGSMVLGRLAGHWISTRLSDRVVLLTAGAVSGVGTVVIAVATSPVLALAGFAVTGAAISVAAPTVYGLVGRRAAAERRGASIGATSSIGYVGLLLGPVIVGQLAGAFDLRIAFACLTAVSAVLTLTALFIGGSRVAASTGTE